MIKYNNYVVKSLHDKYSSHYSLLDITYSNSYNPIYFEYEICPIFEEIEKQAYKFAVHASTLPVFSHLFLTSSNRMEDLKNNLRRCYLYSYVKTFFYGYCRLMRVPEGMISPVNNLCFVGHKAMFDLLVAGQVNDTYPNFNQLTMRLTILPDHYSDVMSWEFTRSVYDDVFGQVYNSQCESLLQYIYTHLPGTIEVSNFGDTNNVIRNLSEVALGNTCYSLDQSELCFIASNDLASDKASFYFGKAICSCISKEPLIDIDDRIYDTINSKNYDVRAVGFEVFSITGFDINGNTSFKGRSSDFSSSYGNISPSPDDNPSIKSSKPNYGDNRSRRKTNNNKPLKPNGDGLGSSIIKSMKNASVSVKNLFLDYISDSSKHVNQYNAIVLADVLSTITGRKISRFDILKFRNNPLYMALDHYGISDINQYWDDDSELSYLENNKLRLPPNFIPAAAKKL